MRVYLIGFMGCGKTTLGKKLANKLGAAYIDLDKQHELKTGLTIAGYFEKYGETAFRESERLNLIESEYPQNAVISTGGGLPCFYDNMDWMNVNGTTIYISMTPMALFNRLVKGKQERPLIRDLNDSELLNFITEKLAQREQFYRRAAYILNGIDLTAEKMMEYISNF